MWYSPVSSGCHRSAQRTALCCRIYDHTADDYIKKKLSDRLYRLRDGTLVQRDWYSSFLLYCYDYRTQDIDKDKCITDFGRCYDKEKALIAWIKANHIKILNSGIKVA